MEECFARVETKYLVSLPQAKALEEGLRRQGMIRMDFGSPTVQSLYYDTSDRALIRASLERPAYKEKLRLRAYGKPEGVTQSFLEIKKKYRNVVYKRRTTLPLQEAMESLKNGFLPETAGQVGREVQWMLHRYDLRPSAIIAYDRDAWFCQDTPEIRVTLDRNLSFRDWALDLNLEIPGLTLLPADQRLLEVKTDGAYPLWLTRLLEETMARRVHFSKYGLAWQRYMQTGKEGNEGSGSNCSTVSLRKGV